MSDSKPPSGLLRGGPGRRFWHEVMARFDPDLHELRILEAAARTMDDLSRLEGALAEAPTVVTGSRGQQQPHPLFQQVRGHRLALQRHLMALGLDEAQGRASASEMGRKMALIRHNSRGNHARQTG